MDNDTYFKDLQCPQCSAMMELQFSPIFRLKSGARKPFYRCVNYPECDGIHGAHPNGAPMGIPADRETRQWRTKAHKALNTIFSWRSKSGRHRTYEFLKEHGFGHIGSATKEECEQIIKLVEKQK